MLTWSLDNYTNLPTVYAHVYNYKVNESVSVFLNQVLAIYRLEFTLFLGIDFVQKVT